jgi:hypothetical protein
MSYTYDALKSYVPEMVEVLIDSVRNPAFLEWEVKEQVLVQLKLIYSFLSLLCTNGAVIVSTAPEDKI